jgi:recombination protein RecT
MTDTKTQERTAQAAPAVAPEAKPLATISKREAWQGFQDELEKRANEIGSQLPSNVSRDRFMNAAIAAVKATPAILTATPRSLFSALTKAAQDGLLPDGREGIITVYQTKKDGVLAQWNPMFYGIRKRARELDGIIIDAQVVVEGDEFEYSLGDEPHISHTPKARSEAITASAGIAVYAIFRHPSEGILHREVMWKPEVFAVMNQSRAKDSLMWTTFWTEGWRKTVGRRGAKSVPVSPALERLITRDDENFTFDRGSQVAGPAPALALPEPEEPPPKPGAALHKSDHPEGGKNEEQTPADAAGDFNDDDSSVKADRTPDELLADLEIWLAQARTAESIEEVWDQMDIESEFASDPERMGKAIDMKARHIARVEQAADEKDALVDKLFPGARAP